MAENEGVEKKRRGRPPGSGSGTGKTKRGSASGRKYFVVDASKYEEFIAGLTPDASINDAMTHADALVTSADEAEPGVAHRYAIFEEAGILATEVVKKVNRNFVSSRTIVRQEKGTESGEGAQAPGESAPSGPSTEEAPRSARRKRE